MKSKKSIIKKIIIGVLPCILTAAIAVGATLAFMTDKESKTNTFTIGDDIDIELDEDGWNDGDPDDPDDPGDGEDLVPGDTKYKDPTITVTSGEVYARIKVEFVDNDGNYITDTEQINKILSTLYYDTDYNTDAQNILKDNKYTTTQLAELIANNKVIAEYNTNDFEYDTTRTSNVAIRYYNLKNTAGPGTSTTLFTSVVIPSDWTKDDIDTLRGEVTGTDNGGYKIIVTAEAIQKENVENAAAAWTALDAASSSATT